MSATTIENTHKAVSAALGLLSVMLVKKRIAKAWLQEAIEKLDHASAALKELVQKGG